MPLIPFSQLRDEIPEEILEAIQRQPKDQFRDYSYYSKHSPEPSDYRVLFNAHPCIAPDTYATAPVEIMELLSPTEEELRFIRDQGPANKKRIGYGDGFSLLKTPIVMNPNIEDRRDESEDAPIADNIDFVGGIMHLHCDVVSERCLRILQNYDAILPDMCRPIFFRRDRENYESGLYAVDFPCAPIIDYQKSSATFRVNSYDGLTNGCATDSNVPVLISFDAHTMSNIFFKLQTNKHPIVREAHQKTVKIIASDLLELMQQEGIVGPDYWLKSTQPDA